MTLYLLQARGTLGRTGAVAPPSAKLKRYVHICILFIYQTVRLQADYGEQNENKKDKPYHTFSKHSINDCSCEIPKCPSYGDEPPRNSMRHKLFLIKASLQFSYTFLIIYTTTM